MDSLTVTLPWRAVTSRMKCGVLYSFCEGEISEPRTKDLDIQGVDIRRLFFD
jgi:hypothetical protein